MANFAPSPNTHRATAQAALNAEADTEYIDLLEHSLADLDLPFFVRMAVHIDLARHHLAATEILYQWGRLHYPLGTNEWADARLYEVRTLLDYLIHSRRNEEAAETYMNEGLDPAGRMDAELSHD